MKVLDDIALRRRAIELARERVLYFRMGEWVRIGGYRESTPRNDLREFCQAARRIFAGCRALSAFAQTRDESFRSEVLDTVVSTVSYLGGRGGAAWDAAAAGDMAAGLFCRLAQGSPGDGPAPLTLVESVRAELSDFFVAHCLDVVDD